MTVRRALGEDLPALIALAESDAVRPYLAYDTPERLRQTADDPAQELLVVDVDGALAGGARLHVRNARSRISEVRSLMVDPRLRGRGVGATALRAIAGHAFGAHGAHRLEAEVLAFNVAALRAFERAGFTREGVRRRAYDRGGAWQDSVMFGLLADER